MRLFLSFLKSLVLWVCISTLPVFITFIFINGVAALGIFIAIGLALLIDSVTAERRILKILRPGRIEIAGVKARTIEDPSSHTFITKSLLSSEPTIWITRGALSLLSPEEILPLVRGMVLAGEEVSLRFETILTSWMIRITAKIPIGFKEVLFFREKRTKTILIRETARGIFWTLIIVLLEAFYFKPKNQRLQIPEEVLRKLEAESRRCVPRLPVALSSHSAVAPWPDAILTLGRSCLLPSTAVNL